MNMTSGEYVGSRVLHCMKHLNYMYLRFLLQVYIILKMFDDQEAPFFHWKTGLIDDTVGAVIITTLKYFC